jgi:hypothetical protein
MDSLLTWKYGWTRAEDHVEGGVEMLQLLVRLECKRQDLIRRRLLRNLGNPGSAYLGIAGLLFFIFLFPMLLAAPAAVAATPVEAELVGTLVLVGFVLCATVVGAPIGLMFL